VDGVSVGHAGRAVTEVCDGRDATQTAGGTEPPTYATQRHEHFNGNTQTAISSFSDRVLFFSDVSLCLCGEFLTKRHRDVLTADEAHRSRGNDEAGIVDEVAWLFFQHHGFNVFDDLVS
jgi:hypothetical protein